MTLEYSSDFDLRVLSLFFCGDSHGGQHEEAVALHGIYTYSLVPFGLLLECESIVLLPG